MRDAKLRHIGEPGDCIEEERGSSGRGELIGSPDRVESVVKQVREEKASR